MESENDKVKNLGANAVITTTVEASYNVVTSNSYTANANIDTEHHNDSANTKNCITAAVVTTIISVAVTLVIGVIIVVVVVFNAQKTPVTSITMPAADSSRSTAEFSPQSKCELRLAILSCLHRSAKGLCSAPYGLMGTWDVSSVTDLSGVFKDAASFNEDISSWDVSEATDMSSMFEGAKAFNQPIENWDMSKVTRMDRMFYGASSFNQPLCTMAWVDAAERSKVVHSDLFHDSPGKVCIYDYEKPSAKTAKTTIEITTKMTTITIPG